MSVASSGGNHPARISGSGSSENRRSARAFRRFDANAGESTDMEQRLQQLGQRYRRALSAAVVAKCRYFSIVGEPSYTRAAVQRAEMRWQQVEAQKRAVVAQIACIEQLGADLTE